MLLGGKRLKNTGNTECISFNLEMHKLKLCIKNTDTLRCGLCTVSVTFSIDYLFFFSNYKKVNMTTLRPIKWGAAGVVTFCLCWRRPFPGHSCRVSEYHHSVRLPSGSFSVFTFKRLVGQSMWKGHQYAKHRRIHAFFFCYSYNKSVKLYLHLLPKNCTCTVTA